MKKVIFLSLAASVLIGCATTQTAYGPINEDGIGYRNIQLEPDRFRVSFTARNEDEARDYVLLRAAELADAEGFSHFKIVNGASANNGPGPQIGSVIGVSTGGGFKRGGPIVDLGLGIGDLGRALEGDKAKETIEVIGLYSDNPQDPDIYHAASIIKSVQPPVFQ